MRQLRSWFMRVRNLFRKTSLEQDLAEELESNIALEIEHHLRSGVPPEEARRRTLAKYGSLDSVKEQCKDHRAIPLLVVIEQCWADLRYASRVLFQNKGWNAVAVLSLAFGIGANAGLFGLFFPFFEKLPVRNPDELVAFRYGREPMLTSYSVFEELRLANRTLSDIFAFSRVENCPSMVLCPGKGNLIAEGKGEAALFQYVSGNYFTALGISSMRGRTIRVTDDMPSAEPVAVISTRFWEARFQRNPAILGASVLLDNEPLTIVGVLPPDVKNSYGSSSSLRVEVADIFLPLALEARTRARAKRDLLKAGAASFWQQMPNTNWLAVMGRLKPGVTAAQVEANLGEVVSRATRDEWNSFLSRLTPEERADPYLNIRRSFGRARIAPGSRGVAEVHPGVRRAMVFLSTVCGILLFIVCMNVTNLLLARAAVRQREIAVRWALGASRRRLLRQLLIESILLALAGGIVSAAVAHWPAILYKLLVPAGMDLPALNFVFDWRVLGFTIALAALTGLAFGIGPALRAVSLDRRAAMHGAVVPFGGSRSRMARALLMAQVGLSIAFLIVAGLFTRAVHNMRSVQLGFNPRNVAVFTIDPAARDYSDARIAGLQAEIADRLSRIPGVRSVTFSDRLLLGSPAPVPVSIRMQEQTTRVDSVSPWAVHHNFFTTMEIPLRIGRLFTGQDHQAAPRVAIVNEAFVRAFSSSPNPIGAQVSFTAKPRRTDLMEIVGVVGDVKTGSFEAGAQPRLFTPYLQHPAGQTTFEVRTVGEPSQMLPVIRAAVHAVDPTLPVYALFTHSFLTELDMMGDGIIFGSLMRLIAGIALVFAMTGLFSLMSYTVSRRTKEIGIRMTVGAQPRNVLFAVMRETLSLVLVGVVAGCCFAFALTPVLQMQLFGLSPHDPATIAGVIALTFAVSAVAGYWPARRASRVDPMVALRHE